MRRLLWNNAVVLLTRRKMNKVTNDQVADMRIKYDVSSIEDDLKTKDPFQLFQMWFQQAVDHPGIVEPNAMNLATASLDGYPTARFVLFKGVTKEGFQFFTNYKSEKGRQLTENPRTAITFYWEPLQKQIRINGNVEKLSSEDSSEYFHKRPVENQIGALVSHQTTVIPSRQVLEEKQMELTNKYEGKEVPMPDYWGGYVVKPATFEFWCGGMGRLHDRIRFRRLEHNETIDSKLTKEGENGWFYERLSP